MHVVHPLSVLTALVDHVKYLTTVDGESSTNDMVLVLANGRAETTIDDTSYPIFVDALHAVCHQLALAIVKGGEGASKLVSIRVVGAHTSDEAKRAARAIANSPLVKTAIAGGDANWGRVVMAVGKAGEPADRDRLSIAFGGHWAARDGQPVEDYDEAPVARHLEGQDVDMTVDLGMGDGRATVWTCDLTHGYISINADYRS